MKNKLYHLQQRLGMTRPEAAAISVLIGLFLLGSAVRGWESHFQAAPEFDYSEVDSLFSEAAARLHADMSPPGLEDSTGIPSRAAPSTATISSGPIDINHATSTQLQRLPRIGPALAARIIEYRLIRGPFRNVDELTRVSGIGPRTMESLRPLVRATLPDSLN